MYVSLPKLGSACAVFLLAWVFSANAQSQQLKKEATSKTTLTPSQVYKRTKMFDSKTGATNPKTKIIRIADKVSERANYELLRTQDPKTGKIPQGIREAEVKFSDKISVGDDSQKSLENIAKSAKAGIFSNWQNRGPFNVGGRTRALAIDRLNENVILAGGVSGGLWRSENEGQSWRKVTRSFQDPSITAIVQDPRPGRGFTWYYGSGERIGNSAGASFSARYHGSGIYKSQDGGRTFELLRATADGTVNQDSPFDIVNSIAVNPVNGDLYVATFNGLHRSQDGGNSFTEVLVGGVDNRVEVKITPSGRIYAAIEFDGVPNAGFFTSTDGNTFTNITPPNFSTVYARTVMDYDPSNEDTVYFLTQDNEVGGLGALLNRYDAASGTWTDLSANLPLFIGGPIGDLNFQTGYNMVMKVHPTNSNIVFVGGTNIYRSTDGVTSLLDQDDWIAGYSPLNDVSLYTNQHPDQHELVFFPSNPNKALSGNDGGVFLTEDITADNPGIEPVAWSSLNNGYITTQPYHVSFDPEANSDDLLAGFQDNGTWFTNSTASDAIWTEEFGGDGSYSAISNNGRTRYMSAQRGVLFRFNFDENGEFVSFTRVEPAGANGFSFINPFILDSNNDNIMYMPIGSNIWRNSDLDGIPLFSNANTTVNWTNLNNSATSDGSTITSLDVSTFPVANTLYYGTQSGRVYKMTNANIDRQEVIEVSEGKGLPEGRVNNINVDASNSDRVIITYSNYNIPSIFITEDGGETWTDISGNLEGNIDGTGSGPSVRSTAFLGGSIGRIGANVQRIFAATSTGLYSTTRPRGQNTVWRKENFVIGNAVVDDVVTRKDGFIAVAAHGNGMFSARFPITANPLPELSLSSTFLLDNVSVAINSEDTVIDVTGLFEHSAGAPIEIEVTNSNPDLVTAELVGDTLTLSYATDAAGVAAIGLIATSGEEQVSEGFTVSVSEIAIYEQIETITSNVPSQNFLDFAGLAQAADDFTIPAGSTWNIDRVLAFGGANGAPALSNATIIIYDNNGGIPGEEIYNSGELAPASEPNDANINIELPEVLTLESGEYWISIYVNLAFDGGNQWFWNSQDNTVGNETHFRDQIDLFGTGSIDWTAASVAFGRNPLDQTFQIFGDIIGTDTEPLGPEVAGIDDEALIEVDGLAVAHPNPSNGTFFFNLGDSISKSNTTNVEINIFNNVGLLVRSITDIKSTTNIPWDASSLAPGVYYARISGEKELVMKLVKQ